MTRDQQIIEQAGGQFLGVEDTSTCTALTGSFLPNPAASTLGGIESLASVSHKWINTISTSGVPSATQPADTDISGTTAGATHYISGGAVAELSTTAYSTMVSGATNPSWATPTANGQCFMSGASSYATTTPSFQSCPAGSGTVTVVSSGSLTSTALVTGGGTTTVQTPSATSTLDSLGNMTLAGKASATEVDVTGAGDAKLTATGTNTNVVMIPNGTGKGQITDGTDTTKIASFDVSNVATATTRTVNIPNANSTTVQANAGATHNFLTAISAQGVVSNTRPADTDISGTTSGALEYVTSSAQAELSTTGYAILASGATNPSWIVPTANGQCLMSGASSYATTTPSFQSCPSGSLPSGSANGDLIVYNGSSWAKFAGNSSGTKLLQEDASGNASWATGGAGTPGGSSGSVQYNNSGAFGGFGSWDGTTFTVGTPATYDLTISANPSQSGPIGIIGPVSQPSAGSMRLDGSGNITTAGASGIGTPTACSNQVVTGFTLADNTAPTSTCTSLTGAFLPNPSASTLGGIESITSASHNWIGYVDTSGVPHQSQPAFTDISGTASASQVDATVKGYSATNTSANAMSSATTDIQLVEFSLASGFLNNAGNVVAVRAMGQWSTGTSQTPTWTFKAKLCTVSGCGSGTVVTLCSWVSAASTASTTQMWQFGCEVGTTTTGSSGIVYGGGQAVLPIGTTLDIATPALTLSEPTASSAINLTSALYLDVMANVSTQSGTKNSCTYFTAKVEP